MSKQFRRVTRVKEKGVSQPFLVLTKGLNDCVWGFTEDEWPKLEARLRAHQFQDQKSRNFVLEMMRHVEDVGIDSLGRILIPGGQGQCFFRAARRPQFEYRLILLKRHNDRAARPASRLRLWPSR